ncbi:MAG TPA: hypothetical protein VFP61_11765 [Acidimicrobiales bacterium]|nr:hypothetical protein [Acidimicrobiales bacterium]
MLIALGVLFVAVWGLAVLVIGWRWPRREGLDERLARHEAVRGAAEAGEWLSRQ